MQSYFESGIKVYRDTELQIEPFSHLLSYMNISSFKKQHFDPNLGGVVLYLIM